MSLSCLGLFILPAIAGDAAPPLPGLGDSSGLGPAELVTFLLSFLPAKIQAALFGYFAIVGIFRHAGKLFTTVFHKICEATQTKADDQFLARVENSAAWRVALFWIDLLLSWKPYRGPSEPVPPTDPPAIVTLPARPPAPTLPTSAGMLFFLIGFATLIGCARLQPGADPIIVRAEQVEKSAKASFDLVLHIDGSRREWFKTNAPAFHEFCEWLRVKQDVNGHKYPRSTALIKNVDNVKVAYKQGRASSNDVVTIITTLDAAAAQASFWQTNKPLWKPGAPHKNL